MSEEKQLSIREKLSFVQTSLAAPKSQYNGFGKYNYRNCEDILEALKPHLKKLECCVKLEDEIVLVGDRYYVKATAFFIDNKTDQYMTTQAFARESETKKGMDDSQVTGATSSYARKYALNGLFAIDDTKDADNFDNSKKDSSPPKQSAKVNAKIETPILTICPSQIKELKEEFVRTGVKESVILSTFNISKIEEMKTDTFDNAMRRLRKTPTKKEEA